LFALRIADGYEHPLKAMKQILFLALLAILFAACKKNPTSQPPTSSELKSKMIGKWNIDTVSTIFRDSTGTVIAGAGKDYPGSPGNNFKFNADNTYAESVIGNDGDFGSGNFVLKADTGFTLVNAGYPNGPYRDCKVGSISAHAFVFSHQRPTLFNGVTPGFIEIVFKLSR